MAIAEWSTAFVGETRKPAATRAAGRSAPLYFGVLSLLALAGFVFGVGNRIAANALLPVAPPVEWVPPLSAGAWAAAFHLQDPLFAACGGAVSLEQFQFMYWWEWLRQASLAGLMGWAGLGIAATLWPRYWFALSRLGGLALLVIVYWGARAAVDILTSQVGTLSALNVGQYRHAVDVTFASAALAAAFAATILPFETAGREGSAVSHRSEWLWIGAILLDIWFGGLFAARNAAPFWPTWPGYEGQLLPPVAQLTSYSPWWLNVTFNPYTIQLIHRGLSVVLFLAALCQVVFVLLDSARSTRYLVRFSLIIGQMLTGISTLVFDVPAVLSLTHQIGAVFLLALSFIFLHWPVEPARKNLRSPRQ